MDEGENNDKPDPQEQAYEAPDARRPDSAMPTEGDLEREVPGGSSQRGHDPYAALRIPSFRYYMCGNAVSILGGQMVSYAVAYQLYRLTDSATALGMVGFVQVLPILMLTLLAGSVIDRFNRKTIILINQAMISLSAMSLGLASLFHSRLPHLAIFQTVNHALAALAGRIGEHNQHFTDPLIPVMYGLLFINGAIRSFNQPAKQSLLPQLVRPEAFANGVTWNSSIFETCSMVGPMLAGFLVAAFHNSSSPDSTAFAALYFINAGCQMTMFLVFLPIKLSAQKVTREPISVKSLLAGIQFVRDTRVLFASITLDMFAVLLGGATALLPVIAERVLDVGPVGLGILRAAPSVGAILMALIMAHLPPMKRPGKSLLWAVAGFGVATMAFGWSTSFPLSVFALFLTGMFDNVSVVTRHSMVQILTPNEMRGRVSAVNSLFISSSNEIGELESGLTTAAAVGWLGPFFGPMAAIVGGGIGSVLVVTGIHMKWPQVAQLGPMAELKASQAKGKSDLPVAQQS